MATFEATNHFRGPYREATGKDECRQPELLQASVGCSQRAPQEGGLLRDKKEAGCCDRSRNRKEAQGSSAKWGSPGCEKRETKGNSSEVLDKRRNQNRRKPHLLSERLGQRGTSQKPIKIKGGRSSKEKLESGKSPWQAVGWVKNGRTDSPDGENSSSQFASDAEVSTKIDRNAGWNSAHSRTTATKGWGVLARNAEDYEEKQKSTVAKERRRAAKYPKTAGLEEKKTNIIFQRSKRI